MSAISVTPKNGFDKVDFSQDTDTHLMLELQGQEITGSTRAPLDIIDVVDHSSSMATANKLVHTKKSLELKINHMSTGDFLTIIAYNSYATVVLPRTEMNAAGKQKARDAVSALRAVGGTDYGQALGTLRQELSSNGTKDKFIRRVIWFSDGCPSSGEMRSDVLVDICKDTPDGWQFTTMGYGLQRDDLMQLSDQASGSGTAPYGSGIRNHGYVGIGNFSPSSQPTGMSGEVNIGLLQGMADAGHGNFYYMKDADSASQAFANELGGLLSTVGQQIKIDITAVKDRVDIKEVLEDLDVEDKGEKLIVSIPDIMSGETKYVTMPIVCKKRDADEPHRPAKIAQIKVTFLNPTTGNMETVEVTPKIQWVKPEKKSTEIHPDVKTELAVIEAIKAQEAAGKMADAGNYAGAGQILADCAVNLRSTGTSRGMDLGLKYGETICMVNNEQGYRRSKAVYATSSSELKRGRAAGGVLGATLSNAAQKGMAQAFQADWDAGPGPADPDLGHCAVHPKQQNSGAASPVVDDQPVKTASRSKTSKTVRY
jgi:hypothetical protein